MRAAAPAKLNLTLAITGRRADGYHELESMVMFTALADVVSVEPAPSLTLRVSGEFAADAGSGHDNLVLKAARLLQQQSGATAGAAIHLEKNIPVGGGLGGGSSDAAATLRLLNHLWQVNLDDAALLALAPQLGADVAMCLYGKPLIARGVGEQITLLQHAPYAGPVVLVHPRKPLLTKDVYAAYHATHASPSHTPRNDLQRPAISLMPDIAEILLALETAPQTPILARVTGSGACCFALYENEQSAVAVASALRRSHPEWWVAVTSLLT